MILFTEDKNSVLLNNLLCWWRIWLNFQYFLDAFETLSPSGEFENYALPFFCCESEWLYRLDDHKIVDLVYLGLKNSVTHGVDDPLFHIVLSDRQKCSHLWEFHCNTVSLILSCAMLAEFDVLFLLHDEGLVDLLLLHECFMGSELLLETSHVFCDEQIDEGEELFIRGLNFLYHV